MPRRRQPYAMHHIAAGAKASDSHLCSAFVSPESSVGGHSEHLYTSYTTSAPAPFGPAQPPYTPGYHRLQRQQQPPPALAVPRSQLPDLDPSQPGPIEIDTSLLYTPQSGNSSADVSQSGAQVEAEQSVNSRKSQWYGQPYHGDPDAAASVPLPGNMGQAGCSNSSRPGFGTRSRQQSADRQRATSAPRARSSAKPTVTR